MNEEEEVLLNKIKGHYEALDVFEGVLPCPVEPYHVGVITKVDKKTNTITVDVSK